MKKIDTCIIIKNEEENIKVLLEQLLKFSDEIHITDTGSTDKTRQIIKEFQKKNNNIFLYYFEWCMDFGVARNFSFYNHKSNADYVFWCDADDRINDKLIETLNQFKNDDNEQTSIYNIHYNYSPEYNVHQLRSALLKRKDNYYWLYPIHEVTHSEITNEAIECMDHKYFDNGSEIIHLGNDFQGHHVRNESYFKYWYDHGYLFDSRLWFYFARDLVYSMKAENKYNKFAIKCLYNSLSTYYNSIFHAQIQDKTNAALALNLLLDNSKDLPHEIMKYFNLIFLTDSLRKDNYYFLGKYFVNRKLYKQALQIFTMGRLCPEPHPMLSFNYDEKTSLHLSFSIGCIYYESKNINGCKDIFKQIIEQDPNYKPVIEFCKKTNIEL